MIVRVINLTLLALFVVACGGASPRLLISTQSLAVLSFGSSDILEVFVWQANMMNCEMLKTPGTDLGKPMSSKKASDMIDGMIVVDGLPPQLLSQRYTVFVQVSNKEKSIITAVGCIDDAEVSQPTKNIDVYLSRPGPSQ